MSFIKPVIAIIGMLVVFFTGCEDIPCRRDMTNPWVKFSFKTIHPLNNDTVNSQIILHSINLQNITFTDTSQLIMHTFTLPMFPDEASVSIKFVFSELTLFSLGDNSQLIDTVNVSEINQSFVLNYTTMLDAISQECGFNYKYLIDTLDYQGCYISGIRIRNKNIQSPQNTYEETPVHIEVYISGRSLSCPSE